jgi:hypothetical protein
LKTQKKRDFGSFQSPEVREKNIQIIKFLYLIFSVSKNIVEG